MYRNDWKRSTVRIEIFGFNLSTSVDSTGSTNDHQGVVNVLNKSWDKLSQNYHEADKTEYFISCTPGFLR